MKRPEVKILPSARGSQVYIVKIDGDIKYKCITKERAEAIGEMIDALIEAYKGEEQFPTLHTLSVSQREKIKKSLAKAGVHMEESA